MSTPRLSPPPPAPPMPPDLGYGWRYRQRHLPDGTTVTDRIPLTVEDLLHPEEEDQVTHAEPHERHATYLYDVFVARVGDTPTNAVLKDVRIRWAHPTVPPHGPDLAVIFGVRERKPWTTFDEETEGVRPSLLVEVVSPSTAENDRDKKLKEYAQVGVRWYVLVESDEAVTGPEQLAVLGHELVDGAYVEMAPDERGRLWLGVVGVWLGVADGKLVCWDAEDRVFENYREQVVARARAETARREAETARRAAEQAQATAETARRAAEQAQAAAEVARQEAEGRAEAEAAARATAEARLRALEEELHGRARRATDPSRGPRKRRRPRPAQDGEAS